MSPEEIERIRQGRRDDAVQAIKNRSTVLHRWINEAATPIWDEKARALWHERAQAVAKLIRPGTRLLDIGCFDMILERYLPTGCTYYPLDVVRRDERTLVVDLNQERLPQLEIDLIVGMGVLEYFHDIPGFLQQAAALAPESIFSYHPLEKSPTKDRLALGWVNALNSCELLALLQHAGYSRVTVEPYKPSLHFYRATRSPAHEMRSEKNLS